MARLHQCLRAKDECDDMCLDKQPGLAFYLMTRELMPFAKPAAGRDWEAP
jgi:hypothetical protein